MTDRTGSTMSGRFLGVTVLGDYVLNEGAEAILDRLQEVGVTAVATNPTVTAPGDATNGSWQPPSDAGASVRLFDRPLWGRRELWVRSGPSFPPDASLYRKTLYSPRRANDLTERDGPRIGEFLRAAKARGMRTYFQLGAVQPPGLRSEDVPRLPDGRVPENRMAATGSLASEAIRSYNRAYARDLLRNYPEIDGIRLDWPEYPCYRLDEAFQDFGDPARRWAEAHGFDFAAMRDTVGRFYRYLHGSLVNEDLQELASGRSDRIAAQLVRWMEPQDAFQEWLRLKAELSTDLLRDWREALTNAGGKHVELSANAFPPSLAEITGFPFQDAGKYCASICPKLYTMHWGLIVRFWGETLLAQNPGLDERVLVHALVHLLQLDEGGVGERIAHYDYPEPDQPHPISDGPQRRKLEQARADVTEAAKVYALIHGYGPPDDFRRRLQLARESSVDGVWINRYGYLSDEKLRIVGER